MNKFLKSTLALLLVVCMMPLSAIAASVDFDVTSSGCDFYNLISKNDYDLAPGAVESEIVINDDTGANRNVIHAIEVDLSNPNISVMPSYKGISEDLDLDDESQWGSQELPAMAEHVEENLGLNVVGGINVNLRYNNNHAPGVLIWNGVTYGNEYVDYDHMSAPYTGGYLAISKEGKAAFYNASDEIPEDTWHALSLPFAWIIKDGVNQYPTSNHSDSSRAPRTFIGIKEDGTLVLVMNDGRQSPYSAGMTNHEMAEVMLAMGCVNAMNCDGGGSSTFISEREGTGELTMKSSPSDGYVRPTLTGLLVISNAEATGEFDHATVSTDIDYVTPGSTVTFSAIGADPSGAPAEIPAEGISWQMKDASMGTVENGVFTSNGTIGTAVVQMVYNGEVVGEADVEVVIPEAVSFEKASYVVPYGKFINIGVKATVNNGLNEVTLKDGDISLVLENSAIGTLSGSIFTAITEPNGETLSNVVATFTGTDISATTTIKLGKGSEVVLDFENFNVGDSPYTYLQAHSYGAGDSSVEIVNAETGRVKSGEKALAINVDGTEYRYYGTFSQNRISDLGVDNIAEAAAIGMWLYIPDEAIGLQLGIRFYESGSSSTRSTLYFFNQEYTGTLELPGWYYFTVDTTDVKYEAFDLYSFELFMYETDGGNYDKVDLTQEYNLLGKYTLYIDDITIDYSDAVDDRDIPEFGTVYISDDDMGVEMKGQTIAENNIGVYVQAKDHAADNAVGLDINTAKVYVDGVQITENFSCDANGKMSVSGVELSEGAHTFRFEIADANGNVASVKRHIVVDATESDAPVSIVPKDPDATNLPIGSAYWIDVKADAIEDIQEVTTTIKLDGVNDWEADFMEVTEGFTATYSIDKATNDLTLTVTKTGVVSATGEGVIVSIPMQVWDYEQYYNQQKAIDPAVDTINWAVQNRWNRAIKLSADVGSITYTDSSVDTFSMAPITVATECNPTTKSTVDSWHVHKVEAVEDKAPTCSENGYTGRTVCVGCLCKNPTDTHVCEESACGSPVDWGTVVPATGHTYTVVGDKLVCDCGDTMAGTGLVESDGNTYYLLNGVLMSGWHYIDTANYYFDTTAYVMAIGEYKVDGMTYTFDENGCLVRGAFVKNSAGLRYYWAGKLQARRFIDLEEGTYWADNDGYIAFGAAPTILASHAPYIWYYFNEETGLLEGTYSGFAEYKGNTYWAGENGEVYYGAVAVEDGIIFTSSMGLVRKNAKCAVGSTQIGCTLEEGLYWCDENGYIVSDGFVTIDGYNYYFTDYARAKGFTKIDEDYYFFNKASGKMYKDVTLYAGANNYGIDPGLQYFGTDGKMYIADPNGEKAIVEEDGKLYFTIDGVKQYGILNELDGEYYYSQNNGELAVDGVFWVDNKNDLIPAKGYWYTFDAEGKLIRDGFVTGPDGYTVYYNDLEVALGFTKIGEDYYFFNKASGKMYKDATLYAGANDYGIDPGLHYFGTDGKMFIPNLNGEKAIVEENGKLYFTVDGVKQYGILNELDGEYYYSTPAGPLAVDGVYWIDNKNDLIPAKGYWYSFDAEGKLIRDGFVTGPDGYTVYYNDLEVALGFTKIGEDYYFFNAASGKMYSNTSLYVKANDYGIEPGLYEFGADGKMIVE